MTITERIPAGTLMRRESAPCEEFVVIASDLNPGDTTATVRYFGSGSGNTWAELVSNLVAPKFRAVAF